MDFNIDNIWDKAAANFEIKIEFLFKSCANCLVFQWGQPTGQGSLRQCSRCKVLLYCSRRCQIEHWMLVHKQHCGRLAKAAAEERKNNKTTSTSSVTIGSHHPFPLDGMLEDIRETVILTIQKIIMKICSTNHPASWIYAEDLLKMENGINFARQLIWMSRKVYPKKVKAWTYADLFHWVIEFYGKHRNIHVRGASRGRMATLDLWSTLFLFLGRAMFLSDLDTIDFVEFKHSNEENKPFYIILRQMAEACSSTSFPSFSSLLKIFCGGSLIQNCSYCSATITIVAIAWEVKGIKVASMPVVHFTPYLGPLFCCRKHRCCQSLSEQDRDNLRGQNILREAYRKHGGIKCDYCHMLSEKTHR